MDVLGGGVLEAAKTAVAVAAAVGLVIVVATIVWMQVRAFGGVAPESDAPARWKSGVEREQVKRNARYVRSRHAKGKSVGRWH